MATQRAITRRRFLDRTTKAALGGAVALPTVIPASAWDRPNDRVHLRSQLQGDFLRCVRTGQEPCAPVEVAQQATNLCSIGAISLLTRRPLTWDPVREEFRGDEEANRLRSCARREPWTR